MKLTGVKVGDYITLTTERGQQRLHIVGEVFSRSGDPMIATSAAAVTGLLESVRPDRFEIALKPGTDPHAYVTALSRATGEGSAHLEVTADSASSQSLTIMLSLIATLTMLLCGVAALGVLNTVVLNTRERVHEIGVLKSLGMTPRQVRTMVVTSMALVGVVGGALAIPLGWWLHHRVIPLVASAAGTNIPRSITEVYGPPELLAFGASGLALAVLGALIPAGWASRTRVGNALRAE